MTRDKLNRAMEILAELERLPAMKVLAQSSVIDALEAEASGDEQMAEVCGRLSDYVIRVALGQRLQAADAAMELRTWIAVLLLRPD